MLSNLSPAATGHHVFALTVRSSDNGRDVQSVFLTQALAEAALGETTGAHPDCDATLQQLAVSFPGERFRLLMLDDLGTFTPTHALDVPLLDGLDTEVDGIEPGYVTREAALSQVAERNQRFLDGHVCRNVAWAVAVEVGTLAEHRNWGALEHGDEIGILEVNTYELIKAVHATPGEIERLAAREVLS